MPDGEPVNQKQFYETMDGTKTEILGAVEKVGDKVNGNSIAIAEMNATITAFNGRIETTENDIRNVKAWNRADSIISAIAAFILGILGIER